MNKVRTALVGVALVALSSVGLQAGSAQADTGTRVAALAGDEIVATPPDTTSSSTAHYNFEVSVKTRYSDKIRIWGYNQNGDHVHSPWFNSPDDWTRVTGWWWNNGPSNVGHIAIEGYQYTGNRTRWVNCKLPGVSQWSSQLCNAWNYL